MQSRQDAENFKEFKSICVPLLAQSRLNHKNISEVLSLLSSLSAFLRKLDNDSVWLKPALISYAFFPLQTILSRNDSPNIPDQVLEKIFEVLELLFRWWWWTCEEGVWEQVLMLAGAVVGGLGTKGKGKERDDETKDAAVRLILCLLKDRSSEHDTANKYPDDIPDARTASIRLYDLQSLAQTEKLIPVLGQTLNSLLSTATSEHLPLRLHSLEAVEVIVSLYVPDSVLPSILPGIASSMTRIALGRTSNEPKGKGWVNGSVVAAALRGMDITIIRAIGDEPCVHAKLVKDVNGLEELTELVSGDAAVSSSQPDVSSNKAYETTRSASWMRASSSQLLIALNSLSSLISHPTPAALVALSSLSHSLLSHARLTLPNCRPLLLSFLLSLSNSHFPSVSTHSSNCLSSLLSPSAKGSYALLQTLVQHTADNLSALPRLLPTQADARIINAAGQIEAACRLTPAGAGVGRLLGPTGHIEKWGWRLLSAIGFAPPPPTIIGAGIIGLLEGVPDDDRIAFPMTTLNSVSTRETHVAIENMLRALGSAGGETCLFAIEWFVRVGLADREDGNTVGALWCACRILEGVVGISLDEDEKAFDTSQRGSRSRRIDKFARWLAKAVSELWDRDEEELESGNIGQDAREMDVDDERPAIEFVKGLTPLETKFDVSSSKGPSTSTPKRRSQPLLVKSFALQLIAVSTSVLQSRFSASLMHVLYPIMHSLVQPSEHLASTAFATLQYATRAIGSATPGNLLLSNFDYALDAVSRRLTRRRLDIDAARVLVLLVRLVGRDIVQRAGDVVEECFDRLDDFHGYSIVVENLVEALLEVVKVVGAEEPPPKSEDVAAHELESIPDEAHFENFLHWLEHRHDPPTRITEEQDEEAGSVPREPLGKGKSKELSEEEQEEEKRMLNEQGGSLNDPAVTPTQALTSQIVSRSITLLTHGAPAIRARILVLLATAAPVLPASSLLPAVHRAWPFVVNRLSDAETPVAAAAASFVAALTRSHGSFMTQRVWDDVWPLFRRTLARLDAADEQSALARRQASSGAAGAGVGTESIYTHSHRLHRAMLATMTAAVRGGVQTQDRRSWDVLLSFRRFLSKGAHEELQACARELYIAFGENNEDTVWLVLTSTACTPGVPHLEHLTQPKPKWDIQDNVDIIFADLARMQQTAKDSS